MEIQEMSLVLVLLLLIPSPYKDVAGFPTFEDYQNATCPHDTFKCLPYADCCLKDSQMCSKLSYNCQEVFAPSEDQHDMCCNALRTNNTTREGLIEVCKYRLGSLTWQENCKVKPQVESSSTVTEIKPPTTGPTQQEKEQVTPSSEASSDWKLGVGLGVPLIFVALILCVVFADKLLLFKNKLLRKGNTARCPTCQHELKDPVKMLSARKLDTPNDLSKKQVIDFEPYTKNYNNINHKGAQNSKFDDIAAEKKQNKLNDESEALRHWIEPENRLFSKTGASGSEGCNQSMLDVDLAIHHVELAQPDYCSEETDNFLHEVL